MKARLVALALIVLTFAGCAQTAEEYFKEHGNDSDYAVRIWEAPLPAPTGIAAMHLIIEVRTPDMAPGCGETWEIWPEAVNGPDHTWQNRVGHSIGPKGGGPPTLLSEFRGDRAKRAAEWMHRFAPTYPARDEYLIWPGPNSNTYVAELIRDCPDLSVDLPPTAMGKDWAGILKAQRSTTGLGFQLDVLVFGVQLGLTEGVEVHFLGTSLGVAFWPPALKLPIVGRLGFQQ